MPNIIEKFAKEFISAKKHGELRPSPDKILQNFRTFLQHEKIRIRAEKRLEGREKTKERLNVA